MPNPLKAQVKIGTINELGNSLEDMKEGAEKEALRLEGYLRAIGDFEKGIQSISEALNLELKETAFDGYIGEPLKVAELVKRYLGRCMGSADNLKVRTQKMRLVQEGQVLGLAAAIQRAKKMADEEAKKIQGAVGVGPLSQTDISSNAGRPDMTAAEDIAQRRAEAKAAKEAAAVEEKVEAGQKTKKKTKKKFKCGHCGAVGHTARSCPDKK